MRGLWICSWSLNVTLQPDKECVDLDVKGELMMMIPLDENLVLLIRLGHPPFKLAFGVWVRRKVSFVRPQLIFVDYICLWSNISLCKVLFSYFCFVIFIWLLVDLWYLNAHGSIVVYRYLISYLFHIQRWQTIHDELWLWIITNNPQPKSLWVSGCLLMLLDLRINCWIMISLSSVNCE